MCLDINIFLFFLSIFLFFIFFDNEEIHDYKSHDIRSQTQTLGEEAGRIMLRYMSMACLPHGVHIVYSQLMYRHQSRVIYCQHGLCIYYINRIAIYQRLLVEFSYDPYLISTLRFIVCVVIGLLTSGCHNTTSLHYTNLSLS